MNGAEKHLYDCWNSLKAFTAARIALGRTGTSVPLKETLDFRLAHAHARDAVYSAMNFDKLLIELRLLNLPVFRVNSKARTRKEYLQRPDLGRQLDQDSSEYLKHLSPAGNDLAFVIADGLSAKAINAHTTNLLTLLVPKLENEGYSIAPVIVVENARVALGDEIGELMKAKITIVLIGERPGLSSSDSLGAYLTFSPKTGLTDESRNCVSNIRDSGLNLTAASDKIMYLVKEALRRKISGVRLKEERVALVE